MVSIDTYNACVDFPIFDAKSRSMKKAFLGAAGGAIGRNSDNTVIVEALRDVNIHLREGDRVGLVGHNGAGKSTLLRLLSGIYEPTRGSAHVRGRVAPVFDLGVGMDPEISGYENILIRGLFLGQTRKQMRSKIDEIAEFTELGDYLSMPLRTYSTGMRIRLALGVVTSIEPDILLLDEGIGAVDAAFMTKARSRLQDLVQRSGILVFASHSNEFLVQLCETALWVDHGEIRQAGTVDDIVEAYEGPEQAAQVRKLQARLRRQREAGSEAGSEATSPEMAAGVGMLLPRSIEPEGGLAEPESKLADAEGGLAEPGASADDQEAAEPRPAEQTNARPAEPAPEAETHSAGPRAAEQADPEEQ